MNRLPTFLFRGLVALMLLVPVSLVTSLPASAATTIAPTTTCSNGVDNTGGLGLICQVTVVNTITASADPRVSRSASATALRVPRRQLARRRRPS